MNAGVGSTGEPTERSTNPSACSRARAANSEMVSQGKSGSERATNYLLPDGLWRQRRNKRVILVDHADLRCSPWRPKVIEEFDVRLVIVGPFIGDIVFVVD